MWSITDLIYHESPLSPIPYNCFECIEFNAIWLYIWIYYKFVILNEKGGGKYLFGELRVIRIPVGHKTL